MGAQWSQKCRATDYFQTQTSNTIVTILINSPHRAFLLLLQLQPQIEYIYF